MTKTARRYYRTLFLGVAAMAALVWAAVDQFGIAWEEMLDLFLVTLSVVVLVILAAAITVALWKVLAKIFSRGD